MNFKKSMAVAGFVAGTLVSQVATASHFRGGAIVSSVDAQGLISFTSTTFWRNTSVGNTGGFALPSGLSSGPKVNYSRQANDTSDSRFTKVVESWGRQMNSGAGTYNFTWGSCCHVGGVANNGGGRMTLDTAITWDGSHANTPIFFNFSSINPEVVRGNTYSDNLGALSGNGQTLSYDQALNTSINSQPAPSFTVDPTTGALTISATDTTAMTHDNPLSRNPGADYSFSGNIKNADGSKTQFEWLFDAVDSNSNNLAPIVTDMVINVFQGDILNAIATATDPNGDALTWLLASTFGPGDISGLIFDPANQKITWDTTGVSLGVYRALVTANDGSLTDTGTITINVLRKRPGNPVPEPGILSLLGLGFIGMRMMRRYKTK